MAFDPAEEAASALEAIQEFGRAVSLTKLVKGTYDPELGSAPTTESVQSGFGADFDYSYRESGVANQGGTVIQTGDRKLLLATSGITALPAPTDKITLHNASGDVAYTVVNVKILAPNGVPILYTVQLRR